MRHRFEEVAFRWNLDEDGDLTLSCFRLIHITYYKWTDAAILSFGRKNYRPAPKSVWQAIRKNNSVHNPELPQ